MSGPADAISGLAVNGRLRDPLLYVLALAAFGLGSGSGLLVRVANDTPAAHAGRLERLERRVEQQGRGGGAHDGCEKHRTLVQEEIDRALRPIERELADIRLELRRVHAKLDRGFALPAAPPAGGSGA